METTKQTYQKINLFVKTADRLVTKGDGENKLSRDHKLAHALRRVTPKCVEALTSYNEQLEDLDWKYASEDSDKNVIRDNLGFKFTKENAKKRNEEARKLFREEKVEVPQYFATEVPEWLSDEMKDIFRGFVIEPEDELV